MKQEKFTALEFLEKLLDSTHEQQLLQDDKIISVISNNKNLVFSEKEKKEIKKHLDTKTTLEYMSEGLEWYHEEALRRKND